MEGDQKKYGYMTSDGYTYHLLLEKARYNRSHPTEAESMLWNYLRKGQLGCKFRRQHPVYDYIPDFVCIPLKLIIEVDGGYMEDIIMMIDKKLMMKKGHLTWRVRDIKSLGFQTKKSSMI